MLNSSPNSPFSRLLMSAKILMMGICLVAILWMIKSLQSDGLPSSMQDFFGVQPSPESTEGIRKIFVGKKLSWCETRVKGLRAGGFALEQKDRDWVWATEAKATPVNFLDVEKWLARYCTIPIMPDNRESETAQKDSFKPVLRVSFIKGGDVELLKSEQGLYSWRGQVFRSYEMNKALEALHGLGPTQ